jgi:hypothetical protein
MREGGNEPFASWVVPSQAEWIENALGYARQIDQAERGRVMSTFVGAIVRASLFNLPWKAI